MIARALGSWYIRVTEARSPWTDTYGVARTLIAGGTLLTLAVNPASLLFRPAVGMAGRVTCDALAAHVSLFCLVPTGGLDAARWLAIAILLVVAIGWRPRVTALPHWWIAYSFFTSVRAGDGGDQVAAVLTFLILPLAVTDPRRWHWNRAPARERPLPSAVAYLSLWLAQIQVAIIYFDSFIEKLRVPEWTDGTVLYYVLNSNFFGAASYLSHVVQPIAASNAIVLVTWAVLCEEFLLGANILLPLWAKRTVFVVGLLFHASIAVLLGITSFAIIMCGALFLGVPQCGMRLRDFLALPVRLQKVRPGKDRSVPVSAMTN